MCPAEKKLGMLLFYNSSGYKKTRIKYTCKRSCSATDRTVQSTPDNSVFKGRDTR